MPRRPPGSAGFTLLPVVLAMSLIAAIAFLLNRDNGINANLIGAQSNRDRARYAAEAGLQAANYAIQGLGCAGGYPISPVTDNNFGGAQYSYYANLTTVLPPQLTPLTLTSIGTYNGASVTLTRSNVTVYQSPPASATLQAAHDTGMEASLNWTNPNSNYGGSPSLKVESATYSGLIQFNLSSIPTGSKITGATLQLSKTNASFFTGTIVVYRVTTPWVAGTQNGAVNNSGATYNSSNATTLWTTAGGDYDPTAVASLTNTIQGWNNWDVTSLMQGWGAGSYPNYGMILVPTTSGVSSNFDSSNSSASNIANYPKLVVTYTAPCG